MADAVQQDINAIVQLVTFYLVGEQFALPIHDTREITLMMDITPVPSAPEFVEGVINLRGQILPIIDLRKRFDLEPKEYDADTRIIICQLGGNMVGLIVDAIHEVMRIPENSITPAPKIVAGGVGNEYIKGITHQGKDGKDMIILINLGKVFSKGELNELGEMAE
ncbi:MAG: chemotaxis protein CheW [Pseudomonadota bacterium]|nr:chemotaxis protein CheW [Pseudomonadota bacterium]